MEENYWKQFLETGKVTDYLAYRSVLGEEKTLGNTFESAMNLEGEDTIESDYSYGHGAFGISYR